MQWVKHLTGQSHVDSLLEVLMRLALVVEHGLRHIDDLKHDEGLALIFQFGLFDLEEFGQASGFGLALGSCEYLFLELSATHADDIAEGDRFIGLVKLATVALG